MGTRTLICIPCMDMIHTDFMVDFVSLRKTGDTSFAVSKNSLVYDARNTLTQRAILNGYDRVLWLDSDMHFEPDLLERLSADMDQGCEYVSGIFFLRKPPTEPVVYSSLDYDTSDGEPKAHVTINRDYPRDTLFPCAGTGCAATMMTTDVLRLVWEKFGPPFSPMKNLGEDLSLCFRLSQLHTTMYCDSRVKVGHIGQIVYDERMYDAQREANKS